MEIAWTDYLYNLSILAVSFAATSALVMVVRQILGGRLSMADVHLLTTFMSAGFAICISSVLPGAFALLQMGEDDLWAVSSGLAALLTGSVVARVHWERRAFSRRGLAPLVVIAFTGYWLSVVLMIVNAVIPELRSPGLFAVAVTLSLALSMWSFLRRVATLSGEKSDGNWDLATD